VKSDGFPDEFPVFGVDGFIFDFRGGDDISGVFGGGAGVIPFSYVECGGGWFKKLSI